MPQRALSHDGKKHVVTVPIRLRKIQGIEPPSPHEGKLFFILFNKRLRLFIMI
jgi:hypothetical protein